MKNAKDWLNGFAKYIFREWIMYFPSRKLRTFFIKTITRSIGKDVFFCRGIEFKGNAQNIIIGDKCFINKDVLLDARKGKIVIGSNVDIGQETNIWTTEHDPNNNNHDVKGGDVIIEDYVWIATRVTILPGVKLGKGCVVACNSVVTKEIPPMAIVAGVPAKIIGTRKNDLVYDLSKLPKPFFF